MSEIKTAVRGVITIAGQKLEGFLKPNGKQVSSMASATKAVNKPRQTMQKFLDTKQGKALLLHERNNKGSSVYPLDSKKQLESSHSKGSSVYPLDSKKQLESSHSKGSDVNTFSEPEYLLVGKNRIRVCSSLVVAGYWQWEANKGNPDAQALVIALNKESIDRRWDTHWGTTKTEEQYEVQTTKVRLDILRNLLNNYPPNSGGIASTVLNQALLDETETQIAIKTALLKDEMDWWKYAEIDSLKKEEHWQRIREISFDIESLFVSNGDSAKDAHEKMNTLYMEQFDGMIGLYRTPAGIEYIKKVYPANYKQLCADWIPHRIGYPFGNLT